MKASTVIAAAVVGVTAVSAQAGLAGLPACALNCAIPALTTTGCAANDVRCICSNTAFISSLTPCVQRDCSAKEFETVLAAATALCLESGVTLSPPSPTSTPSPGEVSSIMSSQSSLSSAASSIAESFSSVLSNATAISTPAPTGNATITGGRGSRPSGTETDVSAPSPSRNAAGRKTIALGGLGAVAVAFAAFL